ncbi:MAG: hypothetical protein LBU84_13720 [Prevotella sp.]|nr:hypothetical protein [Prevotella sp.]
MNKKNLKTKDVMKDKKNEEVAQNEKITTQYYVMDEQHDIVLGDEEFNEEIDGVMESSEKKLPQGEILLINESTKGGHKRRFWVSTSKASLIDFKENRKRPMLSVGSYIIPPEGSEKPITNDATQYYLLSELDVIVDTDACQNQEFDEVIRDLNLSLGEIRSFSGEGFGVYRTVSRVNIPAALPGVDIPEGEVFLFKDFGFRYLISSNKETLEAIMKNRIICMKKKEGRKKERVRLL